MELYPAVDIRGGRVAHVRSGNAFTPSVYGDDPVAALARLAAEGARWAHLVDLDRAYGTGVNRDVVRTALAAAALRTQVGGSLRTEDAIDEMLAWGAARVVIGCAAAATDPELVVRLVRRIGTERLAVAIDATDGRVTPRGAPVLVELSVPELGHRLEGAGVRTVIYTDVRRDGMLAGPDVRGAVALAGAGLDIVVGGGIAGPDDVRAVRAAGLAGVIVGRALHEGRLTLREALVCAAG